MPIAATVRLPEAHWKLVNLLHRRHAGTKGWLASAALRTSGASGSDLAGLIDAEFVTAVIEGTSEPIAKLAGHHSVHAHHPDSLRLSIGVYGVRWATSNPLNRALTVLADSGGATGLRALLGAADIDNSVVVDLDGHGLVEVLAAATGERIVNVNEHRLDPAHHRVRLTRRGWERLAV